MPDLRVVGDEEIVVHVNARSMLIPYVIIFIAFTDVVEYIAIEIVLLKKRRIKHTDCREV